MPLPGKNGGKYCPRDELNARDLALSVLLNVTENGEKSGEALNTVLVRAKSLGLKTRDGALCARIATGTLSRLITADAIINGFSSRPPARMRPVARGILRLSVYQLLYMDRIPGPACCNEAVKLAKLHSMEGLGGFINGVLRSVLRDKEAGGEKISSCLKTAALRYSVPEWIYRMTCSQYGTDCAEGIFASWLSERKNSVRYNLSRVREDPERTITESLENDGFVLERTDIRALLRDRGTEFPKGRLPVIYEYDGGDITKSRAFKQGWVTVQDTASALAASYAAPEPGDHIIDVCAAPGGKSLALADLMGGEGLIEARDISAAKTALIAENAGRCGFANIKTGVYDATRPDEDSFYRADILMADLPCTGLGVAARKPDIKLRLKPYSVSELQNLQRDILRNVSRYVKPHGRLIYSTCTVTESENHANAAWAADELGFRLLQESVLLPGPHNDGFYTAVLEKKY